MKAEKLQDMPTRCPVTGSEMHVTELTNDDGSVTVRGHFRLPTASSLPKEHSEFLEVFLRSRGVISTVEKELGLSYPTVRAKLDALLEAMGMVPYRESTRVKPKSGAERQEILDQLERGDITAAEAKERLRR